VTWIILIITLDDGISGVVPFPDDMSCGNAIPAPRRDRTNWSTCCS
jgi:hypothetical protein